MERINMRILVVEDEQRLSEILKKGLTEEGYAVDTATDGREGFDLATSIEYDVILLDWRLPKLSGVDMVKHFREAKFDTPVLMLTARDETSDRVLGLDAGADDYLTKPFAFDELLARIRALLRRGKGQRRSLLEIGDLVLDPISRSVYRGEEGISLSTREYSLLEYFLRNQNRVLSRTSIAEHVWEMPYALNTNVIDVYVKYLRQKLDVASRQPLIHTVRGTGYVMRLGEDNA